jgi:hypothetical protein
MSTRTFASLALAGAACLATSRVAMASGNEPGSLLVYPAYDNRVDSLSVVSVVNTDDNIVGGNVAVEFIYIDGDTCLEFNRTHLLTQNDTFTAVTRFHNPNATQGYVYVFAKNPSTGQAIAWDYLIGSMFVTAGTNTLGFESIPYVFKAGATVRNGAPLPDRTPTDFDGDGVRDLNGLEYERAGDVYMIPLFIGNDQNVVGELVLLGLTGIRFQTIVNFLIYNDNEEIFSSQVLFDCWDRIPLTSITNVFTDAFLDSTNDNPLETQGLSNETGWYEMDGLNAFSTAAQVVSPAFLAMQIQRIGGSQAATIAFQEGRQGNGDLLPIGLFGDQPPN